MEERQTYWEVWDMGKDGITTCTEEYFQNMPESESDNSNTMLHRFVAATHEEALSIRNLRMGFGAYIPEGDPEVCPHGCGSFYYPEGSGQCPYCGPVRRLTRVRELPGFDELMAKHFSDNSILLDELKTSFGDLELMLLPSEHTQDELERHLDNFITSLKRTDLD